jgi:hypothetical protein
MSFAVAMQLTSPTTPREPRSSPTTQRCLGAYQPTPLKRADNRSDPAYDRSDQTSRKSRRRRSKQLHEALIADVEEITRWLVISLGLAAIVANAVIHSRLKKRAGVSHDEEERGRGGVRRSTRPGPVVGATEISKRGGSPRGPRPRSVSPAPPKCGCRTTDQGPG